MRSNVSLPVKAEIIFILDQVMQADDTFGNAIKKQVKEVVIISDQELIPDRGWCILLGTSN